MTVLTPNTEFRDYNVDGVSSSGSYKPKKANIRALLNQLAVGASLGALIYSTKAQLDANTGATDNQMAWVVADSTGANNGMYQSLSGSWTKLRGFPDTAAVLTNIGGTANAITADTDAGVDPAEVLVLVLPDPPGTNTSATVTIALNGDSAESVKAASGANLAIGDIVDGVGTVFFRSGSEWRQLISSAEGAQFDHQGAYDNGTTYTEGQVVTGSDDKWYQLKVASATGDNPVSGGSGDWLEILDGVVNDGSITLSKIANNVVILNVSDRTELKAVDTSKNSVAYLKEAGRTGHFVFQSGDFSTQVAEDTAEGVYVKATAIAASSGAWVRMLGPDGYRPEWFGADDTGATDVGPAWRLMIDLGLLTGVTTFSGSPGATYLFASYDPDDVDEAKAIVREGLSQSLRFIGNGATILADNDIRSATAQSADEPGTVLRITGDDTNDFEFSGWRVDLSDTTAATSGVPTIGGVSLGGMRLNLRDNIWDHGTTTPSGDAIGVGGGDQSVFATSCDTVIIASSLFIGAPDLGVYLSASGGKNTKIIGCHFYRCENAIGAKRNKKNTLITGCTFEECGRAVYNPTADGLDDNGGEEMTVTACYFKKIQEWPIDIGANGAGSVIANNKFEDFSRRISDGAAQTIGTVAAVRVRAPNCVVTGNSITMVDWSETTTSGHETVGINASYVGGSVMIGADNSIISNNTIDGVHDGVVVAANVTGVREHSNEYTNLSGLSFVDSGTNTRGLASRASYAGTIAAAANVYISSAGDI